MVNKYPENICVHGNGFIQISLGGSPETRIHIWTERLMGLTQCVNTRLHNHRFGFVSSVIKGALVQRDFLPMPNSDAAYTMWTAGAQRLPTGNRPLIRKDQRYYPNDLERTTYAEGQWYEMQPYHWHESIPLTEVVVTLMTKTKVISEDEYQASVMCPGSLEPDQEYDRFQIPFDDLRREIVGALKDTPLEGVQWLYQ